MTRVLKTSGFIGLAVMMTVGLYQNYLLAFGSGVVPQWLIGGHAHLGVLSILAVVVGFVVPALGIAGRLRHVVTGLFLAGQWGLPLTVWIGEGGGVTALMPTTFLWGLCLVAAMLLLAWRTATGPSADEDPSAPAATADD